MTDTSFTSLHVARRKTSKTKTRPRRVRLLVEELETRIVPSFFPDTTNGIHIIEDQLPGGLSNAMVRFVATHMDGTQKELLSQTNQFRAINPDFTVLHYQLGTGNSPYDYIINNQWASDWGYVNQQESWFAHQSYSGEPQATSDLASGRVGNSTGWDQADIANSAWQQYTLNQVLQNMASTGSNAWFADSFTYGIGGAGYNNPVPTRYQGTNAANPAYWPGGVTWTDQLGNWAQAIENAFAQYNAANGTNYKFLPNLDGRATSWEPNWYNDAHGVPFIDGAFLESFGQYTDTYNWTLSMNRGLNLTDHGKIVIMQPYPSSAPNTAAGQQQIDFFLGTYLLLKGNQTYLNIDYGGGVQYYPEYQLNLGTPTTPLPSDVSAYLWNGVYRRDFQNGFVLVNPGSITHTLNLGGTYQKIHASGGGTMTDSQIDASGNYIGGSLSYQNVRSVTLTGGSAAIFLKQTHFSISAPASTVAGSGFNITVTALDPNGATATSYTGTVHFTSTDKRAVLPGDYTFTAADAGVHVFTNTVILKTAGSQTITATDTSVTSITGKSSAIKVNAAAVDHFKITAPTSSTAGAAFSITVAAQDAFNNSVTNYLGTIHFTSSDLQAVLPTDYTFAATDKGTHTFTGGVTLKTAGTQTVTATDKAAASVTGSISIKVSAAKAATLRLGAPSAVTHGIPFTFTVTILDAFGNIATSYTGTVHFSSSDVAANLPSNYKFLGSDAGVHTFTATLNTRGSQSLTATDTMSASITSTVSGIQVA